LIFPSYVKSLVIAGLVLGLVFTMSVTISHYIPMATVPKPSCYEIEHDDELFTETGHADWIEECRNK